MYIQTCIQICMHTYIITHTYLHTCVSVHGYITKSYISMMCLSVNNVNVFARAYQLVPVRICATSKPEFKTFIF